MIRSFIAIDIPEEVKETLGKLISQIKPSLPKIGWTKAQNIHLTIKFLGNIQSSQIPAVKMAMEEICMIPSFSLKGHGLGIFPNIKRPRVIWVGLQGELSPLKRIQFSIEKTLEKDGFKRETRGFHPHLTLGRIKSAVSQVKLLELLQEYKNFSTPAFEVKELILYKSELRPEGARYTPLERVPLR